MIYVTNPHHSNKQSNDSPTFSSTPRPTFLFPTFALCPNLQPPGVLSCDTLIIKAALPFTAREIYFIIPSSLIRDVLQFSPLVSKHWFLSLIFYHWNWLVVFTPSHYPFIPFHSLFSQFLNCYYLPSKINFSLRKVEHMSSSYWTL